MQNRRSFMTRVAAGTGIGIFAPLTQSKWLEAAKRARDRLKITAIERYELYLPYHDFNAQALLRYHGYRIQATTLILLKTNLGLVGAGQSWGPYTITDEQRKKYVGSSPFDWIGSRTDLPFNMAAYDLMGKYLDIPAWKLIGEQVRDRIPVCAWSASYTPEMMAEEVKHAAALGYKWLKYHVDEVQNVVDQTRAMQAVAPPGFKIHYDFNMNSDRQSIEPVLDALQPFSIVGRIEDPISSSQPVDWEYFCEKYEWPIVAHHAPLEFIVQGAADGYMAGHVPLGHAIRIAGVAEQVGKPLMLQHAGTYINQSFLAHVSAVFPAATMDQVNLAELWAQHFTNEAMPITDGSIELPSGPGLGVTVNVEKVKYFAQAPRPKYRPFLVRIKYKNGLTIVARHNPDIAGHTDDMRFLRRLLGEQVPSAEPGYMNEVRTEFWDDVEDRGYQNAWRATENQKFVIL